jgi:hypothetical protein
MSLLVAIRLFLWRYVSSCRRLPVHIPDIVCVAASGSLVKFSQNSPTPNFTKIPLVEAAVVHALRRPDKSDEFMGGGSYLRRTGKFLNMPEGSRVLTVCVHFRIYQYSVAMIYSQNSLCKQMVKPCHCTERRGARQLPQNINSNCTLLLCCLKYYRYIT